MKEAARLYDAAGTFDCVEKGDLVSVKLHAGELGNPYYVQLFFVHDIVREVKEADGKPFLSMIDYNFFNEAYHVDCMLQVQEAKAIGIAGEGNLRYTG